MTTNVTAAETPDQPDPFAAISFELHRAADDIATLIGSGLPKPDYFNLAIQPGTRGDGDSTATSVDALGVALTGKPGALRKMSDGTYHYSAKDVRRGLLSVSIYQSVPTEWAVRREAAAALAEREAELEKLRAEVAKLRAAAGQSGFVDGPCEDSDCPNASWPHSASSDLADDPTGLGFSREADDPAPVSPARVPQHRQVGGSAGGPGENSAECACGVAFDGFDTHAEATRLLGLHIEAATSPTGLTRAADQTRGALAFTTPVVTYFSFGHGQTDPDTNKSLLDHYVTVVAPTYEACREAMFASRFGNRWAHDYLAGTVKATEWITRWTEHEVIVAPGTDKALADSAQLAADELLSAARSGQIS